MPVLLTILIALQGWHFHATVEHGKLLTKALTNQETDREAIKELKADLRDLQRQLSELRARLK